MKLSDIIKELGLEVLTSKDVQDKEVSSGICCDLLSWVMANSRKDAIWITVQTHINIVAVASLLDIAAIIIPSEIVCQPETIKKADEEGIIILASNHSAFNISGRLFKLGVGLDD